MEKEEGEILCNPNISYDVGEFVFPFVGLSEV